MKVFRRNIILVLILLSILFIVFTVFSKNNETFETINRSGPVFMLNKIRDFGEKKQQDNYKNASNIDYDTSVSKYFKEHLQEYMDYTKYINLQTLEPHITMSQMVLNTLNNKQCFKVDGSDKSANFQSDNRPSKIAIKEASMTNYSRVGSDKVRKKTEYVKRNVTRTVLDALKSQDDVDSRMKLDNFTMNIDVYYPWVNDSVAKENNMFEGIDSERIIKNYTVNNRGVSNATNFYKHAREHVECINTEGKVWNEINKTCDDHRKIKDYTCPTSQKCSNYYSWVQYGNCTDTTTKFATTNEITITDKTTGSRIKKTIKESVNLDKNSKQYLEMQSDISVFGPRNRGTSVSFWFKINGNERDEKEKILLHFGNRHWLWLYEEVYFSIKKHNDNSMDVFTIYSNNSKREKMEVLLPNMMNDEWHHVVCTFISDEWTFYADGECLAKGTAQYPSILPRNTLQIGAPATFWHKHYSSSIGDFYLFQRVLKNGEIMFLYTK